MVIGQATYNNNHPHIFSVCPWCVGASCLINRLPRLHACLHVKFNDLN